MVDGQPCERKQKIEDGQAMRRISEKTTFISAYGGSLLTKRMHSKLTKKAVGIRLVFTDVDGVLTDTGVYYNETGDALRRFSVRDGMGVERLRSLLDIETVIISGEKSPSIKARAKKLNIRECHLGIKDKGHLIRGLMENKGLTQQEIAYIGDDLNDLEAVREAGFSACPADAVKEMLSACDYVCLNKGGYGAFREFAELIIMLRKTKKEA